MTAYNATMYNKETFNNIDRVIGIVTRGAPFLKWGTRVFLSFPKLLFIRSEHMLKIRKLYEMALFWLVKVSPSWKIQFLRCARSHQVGRYNFSGVLPPPNFLV